MPPEIDDKDEDFEELESKDEDDESTEEKDELEIDRGDSYATDDDDEEEGEEDSDDAEDKDSEKDAEEADDTDDDTSDGEEEEQDHRIPKQRFDEVISQREDARELSKRQQDQIEQLLEMMKDKDAKVNKEPEFVYDFDEAEVRYTEAIIEGEATLAAGIRKEIRTAEKTIAKAEAKELSEIVGKEARSESQKIRDETLFDQAVIANESKYTFLDQASKDYNSKAVDKINNLYEKFVKSGATQAESLQEAVDLIAPLYVKEEVKKEGLGKKKPKREVRESKKRNAEANNSQPAKLKGKTSKDPSIDEYDITKMTDAQYAKLPSDIKRKLRGDS